jgi:hypothetical protein
MSRRYAKRRDENHKDMLDSARRIGADVIDMASFECGFDALMRFRDKIYLVEIKNGRKCKSARKLTDSETQTRLVWMSSYHVVKNVVELYEMFGVIPKTN